MASLVERRHPEAAVLWNKFRNAKCVACPLHETAQTVCLFGDGPVRSTDIMIIGEAPGYREDDIGKPFAGASGKLLDEQLRSIGLSRHQVYVTNVAKCRPPDNRAPHKTEREACKPYLEAEINAVKPKFILTLGNSALSLINNRASGITKYRGDVYDYGDSKVLPTFHPAAVLRNPRNESVFRRDFQAFGRLVRGVQSDDRTRVFLIQSKESLGRVLEAILKASAVSYDFETNGKEEWLDDALPLTVAISIAPGMAFVVPLYHPGSRWKRPDVVLGALGRVLTYTNAKRIAHNAKFDDKWFIREGYPVYASFDTMLAAHMLDENQLKGLKPLAQVLLGVDAWAISTTDLEDKPLSEVARYNAKDADYTLRLYYLFREKLLRQENKRVCRLFMKLLMPVSHVLTRVERTGLWVDPDRLASRLIEVESQLSRISDALTNKCGRTANWNSTQQLAKILYSDLKLPLFGLTAKGNPSTAESLLLQLARHKKLRCWCKGRKRKHDVPNLILEWRHWFKYKSVYFHAWTVLKDEHNRLHGNYKITGTVTGRLSSGKEDKKKKEPGLNLQQIPRDPFARSVIGAPPGWTFATADFSQIEMRIAAHLSQDPQLLRTYITGGDAHMETAIDLTKKLAKDVTPGERKKAKAVNFGFLFGMYPKKFIEYARDHYELEVTLEEATEVRKAYFRKYPALQSWHARQRRLVNKYGRVESLIGRVRHLPDVYSEEEKVKAEAERQAINSPVQGLASDFTTESLVLIEREMDPREARPVGIVHDELQFELRDDVVEKWCKRIKYIMEVKLIEVLKKDFGVTLSIPIEVEIKVGQHWGEGKVWK